MLSRTAPIGLKSSAPAFEKVLRAYETGGITYEDFQAQLKRLFSAGATPSELFELLRRRESIEPLSVPMRTEVLSLLNDAMLRISSGAAPAMVASATAPAAAEAPRAAAQAATGPSPAAFALTAIFAKVVNPFERNAFTDDEVLAELKRVMLATNTTPDALLKMLRRQEMIEPLPDQVHSEVLGLLNEAMGVGSPPVPGVDAVSTERLRLWEERVERQSKEQQTQIAALKQRHQDALASLASEHAAAQGTATQLRDARARAESLTAEVSAVRAALEAEKARVREMERVLSDQNAAADAAAGQGRHLVAERESQISALQKDHERSLAALSASQKDAGASEAALRNAAARAESLGAEVAAVRSAMELEKTGAKDVARALTEKITAAESAAAHARHALTERESHLSSLQKQHEKTTAALASREQAVTTADAALQKASARAESVAAELASARAAWDSEKSRASETGRRLTQKTSALDEAGNQIRRLEKQLKVGESRADALRAQLAKAQRLSSSYLESLQHREWRREYGQSLDEPGQDLEQHPVNAGAASDPAREPPAEPISNGVPARPVASPGPGWRQLSTGAWIGIGVALFALAATVWLSERRAPLPPAAVAAPVVVSPQPGTVIKDCAMCPGMTVLAAGRFKEGSAASENSSTFDKPQHWVIIREPLAMSTNAVTVDEFQQFAAASGRDLQGCDVYDGEWRHRPKSNWKDVGFAQTGSHPVTCVSWTDAKAYADWLSAMTRHHYRLPSAAEWEYAALAGGEAGQPWKADGTDACANANVADESAAHRYPGWTVFACNDGFAYTAPVGTFKPNAFGLNDMLGNVFQWTEDCWHADYRGAPIDGAPRVDGDCTDHELRGGSWFSAPAVVRAGYRNHFAADYRTNTVGIRLVRDIKP